MRFLKRVSTITAVAVLGSFGVQANAADEAPAAPEALRAAPKSGLEGIYFGGLGFLYLPEGNRNLETGFGGRGYLGLPISKRLNLEISGWGARAEIDNGIGDSRDFSAAGIDLMAPFGKSRLRPFGLVGLGYLNEDQKFSEFDNAYGNVGLGALFTLGAGFDIRGEARYLLILAESSDENSRYNDGQIALGLQYTFQAPREYPRAATVQYIQVPAADGVADADGDGVPDNRDSCPNTPPGVKVDAKGCPLDTDGDGVADYLDKCPNTPKGMKVDEEGCTTNGQTLVLRDVNFEFDSARLLVSSQAILDKIASGLKGQPKIRVEVAGHTDSKGSDAYNQSLSDRRAAAVRAYLISQGVAPAQLVARGYGEKQPETTNDTDEGRAQNRRVEMRVLGQPGTTSK